MSTILILRKHLAILTFFIIGSRGSDGSRDAYVCVAA